MITRNTQVGDEACPAMSTEGDDDPRVDYLELAHEVGPKGTLFLWLRVTVVWRTILHDVRYVDVAALHAGY